MGKIEAAREQMLAALQVVVDYSEAHPKPLASEQREIVRLAEQATAAENRYRSLRADAGQPVAEWPSGLSLEGTAAVDNARAVLADARTAGSFPLPFAGGNQPAGLRPPRASVHDQSWGEAVVAAMSPGGRFQAAALSGGAVPVSVPLRSVPISIAQRARFLRELIPGEPAPGGRVAYLRQTVRTNNAAAVAPLGIKPTSIYTMVRVDDRARTVAHLSEPIARQDLSDAGLLREFIDNELRYGLDLALDDQILNGSGTGENMTGILQTSGIQTQAFATDALLSCRKAITKLEISDLEPRAFVMNPTSWEKVELLAASQFAANDNQPAPTDAMKRTLYGVPVVVSNAVAANVALLGDFASSSILFTTQEATVDWSENTYDPTAVASDFQRNLVRFRAEGRWLIAVTRPLGFVSIALA